MMANTPATHAPRAAFSLVELSIVLVILGLLTGGILTGRSLIRSAELRAIVTEKDKYITAAHTFKDKYRALPGDMSNATSFWGNTAISGAPACLAISGEPTGYAVCNGDGNGKVVWINNTGFANTEMVQFWRQLSLVGLIEGTYSGKYNINYSAGGSSSWGYTVPMDFLETLPLFPTSKAGNAKWYTSYNPTDIMYPPDNMTFSHPYNHYLLHGVTQMDGTNPPKYAATLKPDEVWSIDQKLDDGRPGLGKVLVYPLVCTDAANRNAGATANYDMGISAQCGIIFANAY